MLDDSGNTTYGASASVNCDSGFETVTPTILCLDSGDWENATCIAKGTVQLYTIVYSILRRIALY